MILLMTTGEIVSMPFMNSYWTSRSNERNRGQYAALYTIAWGMAQTLGPFLFSLVADHAGFKTLFIVMGTLLVFTAWGFQRLYKTEPNHL